MHRTTYKVVPRIHTEFIHTIKANLVFQAMNKMLKIQQLNQIDMVNGDGKSFHFVCEFTDSKYIHKIIYRICICL